MSFKDDNFHCRPEKNEHTSFCHQDLYNGYFTKRNNTFVILMYVYVKCKWQFHVNKPCLGEKKKTVADLW